MSSIIPEDVWDREFDPLPDDEYISYLMQKDDEAKLILTARLRAAQAQAMELQEECRRLHEELRRRPIVPKEGWALGDPPSSDSFPVAAYTGDGWITEWSDCETPISFPFEEERLLTADDLARLGFCIM